jgi:hypothetical protein
MPLADAAVVLLLPVLINDMRVYFSAQEHPPSTLPLYMSFCLRAMMRDGSSKAACRSAIVAPPDIVTCALEPVAAH